MTLSKLWDNETFTELALPALTTLFGLQMLRVLLPAFVWYLGDSVGVSYAMLGPLAIGTFLAAFLAGIFRNVLGSRRALIAVVCGIGLTRLVEQVSAVPMLDLVATMIGTLLFTFFFPLYVMRTRHEGGGATRKFGRGFLLGFVIDTTIHGALGTLDLSWQPGFIGAIIIAILVAAQGWLIARKPAISDDPLEAGFGDNLPLAAIGPFVFVMAVVFQNVARVITLTGFTPPMALGLLMLSNAIGLAAALFPIVADRSTAFSALVATVFLAILVSRPTPETVTADVLYLFGNLLLFPMVTLIFAGLNVEAKHSGMWRSALANGIGWLLFVVFAFVYYISYDISMPISNTLLPAIAVVLIGAAVLAAMRTMPHLPAASDWTSATLAFAMLIVAAELTIDWRAPQTKTGNGFPVRVMTYNLHNGFNTNGQLNLEDLARTIEQAKPDIVGLQEVSRGWYIDSNVDIIGWLSQRLKMPYIFGPTADRVWGNAILSRYPIKEWTNEELPPRSLLLKRGFIWVRIDVGGGEELSLIASHYHHIDKDTEIRQQQSPVIVQAWNKQSHTLFLGDLNATPDSKEIAMIRDAGLLDAFAVIGAGDGFTFNSEKPYQRIDYIWFSPDLQVSDLLIPRSTASDHLGLAVTVGKK